MDLKKEEVKNVRDTWESCGRLFLGDTKNTKKKKTLEFKVSYLTISQTLTPNIINCCLSHMWVWRTKEKVLKLSLNLGILIFVNN